MSIVSSAPNFFASSSRFGDAVDDDHGVGAHLLRDGDGVQPEAARALDDDRVAVAHADLLQPVRHLRERAVHRRRHLVGHLVRHLEDPAARLQVVVLAVGAAELADGPGAHRHQLVRAGRELAPCCTGSSGGTGRSSCSDAVAFLQRPAERVGRDARAERVHAAGHLVPGDAAGHRREQRRVAAPDVQVGAADAAHRDLDDDAARLRRRDLELLDLVALAGPEQNRRLASGHDVRPFLSAKRARVSRWCLILAPRLVRVNECGPSPGLRPPCPRGATDGRGRWGSVASDACQTTGRGSCSDCRRVEQGHRGSIGRLERASPPGEVRAADR